MCIHREQERQIRMATHKPQVKKAIKTYESLVWKGVSCFHEHFPMTPVYAVT